MSPSVMRRSESTCLSSRSPKGDAPTRPEVACAISRFAMAAFALARQSPTPQATLDECFRVIDAAWMVGQRSQHT